jgi:hypothetical protein
VPFLAVTNLADVPILLVEGEMLIGGDQNRTMNVTVLLPPRERTVVPVSCVEAGRWGGRRIMSASSRHAPGSLRAAKTASLEDRTDDSTSRRSDQGRVWDEVDRQSAVHQVFSETSALDDVQQQIEDRLAERLDRIRPEPGQVGVVCAVGDEVVGLDLFDRSSTLGQYLRGIIAGHALDAPDDTRSGVTVASAERFLEQVATAGVDSGHGVGLGEEALLQGGIAGVGLSYDERLVHLAAFPTPV